ncbi:MAG: response regulator [Saprospiraceae bacterium]|nr:response regulator [Saprospiraceae bacterium]
MTTQVLELTKFEANKGSYNPINFNLFQSLKKLHADFETTAQSRQIDFQLEYSGDEDLVVYWDFFKFSTIVKNLISNALKFTSEQCKIVIDAKIEDKKLTLQVKDNGQGISANDLPHIFGRYYQAKNSVTIQEGGTGIGLAICKEYAKALNGTISVQSQQGHGSVFTLVLPIVENATANISMLPTASNIATETTISTSPSTTEKANLPQVLLVEDNLSMQEYIHYILKENYQVHIVPHGKAALNFLSKNKAIQLIISDLMMPEMNGYELIEALKSNSQYATIPTIMLTALSDTKDKLKALRIGIDDYLTKPFNDEELMARIDNLLDNYEQKTEFVALEKSIDNQSNRISETLSEDQQWLQELEEIILKKIGHTNYSVDDLAHDMAMSRVPFYQKLKSLTGLTPKKYIDELRFQKAREILENQELHTIQAVALRVGLKDQKHFARNFKKRFGKYPSEYLE